MENIDLHIVKMNTEYTQLRENINKLETMLKNKDRYDTSVILTKSRLIQNAKCLCSDLKVVLKELGINDQSFVTLTETDSKLAIIQMLQKDFPDIFPEKPLPKKALKVGIHKDLSPWAVNNNIDPKMIYEALGLWTKGTRYHEALKSNNRYDLNGNIVSTVNHKEASKDNGRSIIMKEFADKLNLKLYDEFYIGSLVPYRFTVSNLEFRNFKVNNRWTPVDNETFLRITSGQVKIKTSEEVLGWMKDMRGVSLNNTSV